MTTPVYGLRYLVQGEPARNLRAHTEDNAKSIEAALVATGVVPAPGLNTLVAGATSDPTPGTLARRDAAGTLQVSPATAPAHPYRKDQVDALLANVAAPSTVYTKAETYSRAEVDALLAQRYTKAQVDALLAAVPINDEMFTATYLGLANPGSYAIFQAPYALQVRTLSMTTQTAIGSNASNYWLIEARRGRAGAFTTFASKTTNNADGAGGQSITPNIDWNMDNISFNASVAQLAKGDQMIWRASYVGAPSATSLVAVNVTVRYTPL